jgi:hypothetical protein
MIDYIQKKIRITLIAKRNLLKFNYLNIFCTVKFLLAKIKGLQS